MKHGSLFSGYEGLGLALRDIWPDVETVWVSDIDKGACKVLAHRYPDAPNLGDITKVDWSTVEPVDIITGGSPCQDVSTAGKRAGMTDGTRSNLWTAMREAIAFLRPSLVIWENVGGVASAGADSAVEPCAGCVGDGSATHLRALGRVLGDLASLGFDAEWTSLRAADVGAAHGRLRFFVVAWPAVQDTQLGGREGLSLSASPAPRPEVRPARPGGRPALQADRDLALLPTPACNDMGAAYTPETWDAWTEKMKAAHGNGNGHGPSLNVEVQRLLPTYAQAAQDDRCLPPCGAFDRPHLLDECYGMTDWGKYAAAIARQEHAFGRPAPAPTETGPKGNPRLSCRFDEWLMGLPDGWITDVPGITHNEALKAAGNGVVPQQAAAALRLMLARASEAAA